MAVVPSDMGFQVTAGQAKLANTSWMEWNDVSVGEVTDWPLHWPHMYTFDVCVAAAEMWL